MNPKDEGEMTFITHFDVYYYVKMPFRLKNARATYRKGLHIVLDLHIGRNIEAYIDDIVVKSKSHGGRLDDLKETFDNLCKYRTKLNAKKCVFRVSIGKPLGYMVSARGIDANLKEVEAIEQLRPLPPIAKNKSRN
jgi:hypothetical protein